MDKKRNFKNMCLRGLATPPSTPCVLGRQRAESELHQKDKNAKHIGCPWFVNSEEYNYCFWKMADAMDGAPISDKEIAKLNCISVNEINEVISSAMAKLKTNSDSPEVQEWVIAIKERAERQSAGEDGVSNHSPVGGFAIPKSGDKLPQHSEVRRSLSYPIHRKGNKVDIYGISSKKSKHKDKRK